MGRRQMNCLMICMMAATGGTDAYTNPSRSLNSINLFSNSLRPLEIDIQDEKIELVSKVYRYLKESKLDPSADAVVDLFSMVHIADKTYYDKIQEISKGYDTVLFELITSENLVTFEGGDASRKILMSKVFASRADLLAQQFNLSTQLDLDLQQKNWYIADLSKEVIDRLETERRQLTNSRFLASQLGGRGVAERVTLHNFFLSDSAFVTILRSFSWLLPCPELAVLMVDWSRMNPRPGGLPPILVPIFESIISGDIHSAQKLAFAQQLLAGLPDAGGWGGAAKSDVEIRVHARNEECCRVLQTLLDSPAPASTSPSPPSSLSSSPGPVTATSTAVTPKKIAVLYGAYHVSDLHNRFLAQGLRAQNSADLDPDRTLVAWSMNRARTRIWPGSQSSRPSKRSLVAAALETSGPQNDGPVSEPLFGPISFDPLGLQLNVLALTILPLYLLLGGVDWAACLTILSKALSILVSHPIVDSTNVFNPQPAVFVDIDKSVWWGLGFGSEEVWVGGAAVYIAAYIRRHVQLLQTLNAVGVQWDKPLFDLPPVLPLPRYDPFAVNEKSNK